MIIILNFFSCYVTNKDDVPFLYRVYGEDDEPTGLRPCLYFFFSLSEEDFYQESKRQLYVLMFACMDDNMRGCMVRVGGRGSVGEGVFAFV